MQSRHTPSWAATRRERAPHSLHACSGSGSFTGTCHIGQHLLYKVAGAEKDGGVLDHALWEVQIECLPTDIPEKITVEAAGMKIGDTVYIKDLPVPAGVKILNDPELTVLSVVPPAKEEVAAEAPTEEEALEPEVIAKGKKEEEEVAEEEGEKPAKEEKSKKEETPPKEKKG